MTIHRLIKFIDGNKLTALDLMAYKAGVPIRRLDEFWNWAFGDTYRKLKTADLIDHWNNLHGRELLLFRHISVVISVRAMAKLFLSQRG